MNEAIIRYETNKPNYSIKVTVKPFPITKEEKKMNAAPTGISVSIYFVMALSFIPASIIAFLVKEKTD